jgi:phage-related tail fiber protein
VICVAACSLVSNSSTASVWVENRSASAAAFFVTDNSDSPAGWYVVPAHTVAHAGSTGLRVSSDVRVNVLGWGHQERHVSECSPGDYGDTLHDVPNGASVRLLIEASGRPSVDLGPEPPGIPALPLAPLGTLSEAQLCELWPSLVPSLPPSDRR